MHRARAAVVLAAALMAAGCGSSAGLSTASTAKPEAQNTPEARSFQVAWTSARAQKCGFNFDPGKLRSGLLAYETAQGASPETLQKLQGTYDRTLQTTADKIRGEAEYCTDDKTAEIKTDLTRHLAGDYTPRPPKVQAAGGGLWDAFSGSSSGAKPMNRDDIFHPTGGK